MIVSTYSHDRLDRVLGKVLYGGVPERSKGPDCKSGGLAFEGSNPSPSTTLSRVVDGMLAGVVQW